MRAAWVVLVSALAAACSSPAPVDDQVAIRHVLEQWPKDFAAKKIDENGVDVFARQPDGSWKIRISHAFPVP